MQFTLDGKLWLIAYVYLFFHNDFGVLSCQPYLSISVLKLPDDRFLSFAAKIKRKPVYPIGKSYIIPKTRFEGRGRRASNKQQEEVRIMHA